MNIRYGDRIRGDLVTIEACWREQDNLWWNFYFREQETNLGRGTCCWESQLPAAGAVIYSKWPISSSTPGASRQYYTYTTDCRTSPNLPFSRFRGLHPPSLSLERERPLRMMAWKWHTKNTKDQPTFLQNSLFAWLDIRLITNPWLS